MVSIKHLYLAALPVATSAWELGVFSTGTTCTLDYAPDSNRAGNGGVTSGCQGFSITAINAILIKDWEDACTVQIWEDRTGCAGEPWHEYTKDKGTQQDNYVCINNQDFPDNFQFKYVCG
ncbi:hypothetical protein N0V90_009985 [Kalmusia sp. IMI 367209]|nr:hypothetical protein N0V90_009985 [Kalmusia sp. IMI 367209]